MLLCSFLPCPTDRVLFPKTTLKFWKYGFKVFWNLSIHEKQRGNCNERQIQNFPYKWCMMKQSKMKFFFFFFSKASLIIFVLGWFLYFWIVLSTRSLIFDTSHRESSLTMIFSSLTILLQKVFSFSAISMLDEMILPHVIK